MSAFVEACIDRYPRTVNINVPENPIIETNSINFINSRRIMFDKLVSDKIDPKEFPQALFSEHIVFTALEKPINEMNFKLYTAPQSLDISRKNNKGIDLLICNNENIPFLGINVKLRKGRSVLNRDGYGWHSKLQAPYIYLSLGNWTVDTREGKETRIRQWLDECAIPKISESGKIPKFWDFRKYLIERIDRSLDGFTEKLDDRQYDINYGLPETMIEMSVLKDKLPVISSVFSQLNAKS